MALLPAIDNGAVIDSIMVFMDSLSEIRSRICTRFESQRVDSAEFAESKASDQLVRIDEWSDAEFRRYLFDILGLTIV